MVLCVCLPPSREELQLARWLNCGIAIARQSKAYIAALLYSPPPRRSKGRITEGKRARGLYSGAEFTVEIRPGVKELN